MKVVVIGAGPAGLSFCDRLINLRPEAKISIFEKSDYVGGISKTVVYKNNRIDIGGHRFFSKSDEVMHWWSIKFPISLSEKQKLANSHKIKYKGQTSTLDGFSLATPQQEASGRVMLLRSRKSRILFEGKLFPYPLKLDRDTIQKIGYFRLINVGISYLYSKLVSKKITTLEDFIVLKFGRKLYEMFFEKYTEKVWGVHPSRISADWGAQRIKGLSIRKVLFDIYSKAFNSNSQLISQSSTETSLIEQFLYPKLGPGQMWEAVAEDLQKKGISLSHRHQAVAIYVDCDKKIITSIGFLDIQTGEMSEVVADYFVSTMPISTLVSIARDFRTRQKVSMISPIAAKAAESLPYRDFVTVGILLNKISGPNNEELDDTWLYVQDPTVKVGRIQFFNNWSPFLSSDPTKSWVGLEYFCQADDSFWSMSDDEIRSLAMRELISLKLATHADILDSVVLREPKTYPAYFGSYEHIGMIQSQFNEWRNLFLVGRNGMHKYNNQDHSMLTAFRAADLIATSNLSIESRNTLWDINAEQEYHEEK